MTAPRGERGTSLVELLVATSVGLSLAALVSHTMTAYQTHYQRAVAHVNSDQQARFALALMTDELDTLLAAPASATCPPLGVHIGGGRMEFAANLYDRATTIRDDVAAGRSDLAVESNEGFESGDLVKIVDVTDASDPGDDIAECVRIAAISAGRWTVGDALPRSFPAGSRITLVNRVIYACDRLGRLMRTQDGGTQRVAQDVQAFEARVVGNALEIHLTIGHTGDWSRRIALGDLQ